jgi:hypothetical protein
MPGLRRQHHPAGVEVGWTSQHHTITPPLVHQQSSKATDQGHRGCSLLPPRRRWQRGGGGVAESVIEDDQELEGGGEHRLVNNGAGQSRVNRRCVTRAWGRRWRHAERGTPRHHPHRATPARALQDHHHACTTTRSRPEQHRRTAAIGDRNPSYREGSEQPPEEASNKLSGVAR